MISSWEKTGLLPDPKCMNIIGEREQANLVVQLARIFFLYGSCRNVLRICKYTTNKILHHVVIMSGAFVPAVHAFMQAVNTGVHAGVHAGFQFSPTSWCGLERTVLMLHILTLNCPRFLFFSHSLPFQFCPLSLLFLPFFCFHGSEMF